MSDMRHGVLGEPSACGDESYSAMSSMSAWVIDLLLSPICWRSPCVVIHTFGVAFNNFMMYDGYIR